MHARCPVALLSMALCGCTEANPFADDSGMQTEAGSTAVDATGSGSTPSGTGTASDGVGTASDGVGTSNGDDPTADATGEPACEIGTHVCVSLAPDGWSGPVALIADAPQDEPPACAAAFPSMQAIAFDEIAAPPAECSCDCSNPQGAHCDRTLVVDNSAGCGSPLTEWDLASLACQEDVSGPGGSYWQAIVSPIEGQCTPTFAEEVVDPEFEQRHTLCAPDAASAGACPDGDVCTPIPIAPFTVDAICIWADGDMDCPVDLGYDARSVLFRDISDTRGCSDCSCDIEGECTGSVYLFSANGCDGQSVAGTAVFGGACVQVSLGIGSGDVSSSYDVDASCEAVGGVAEGAATGLDPLTICCRD